jgi:chemotaxis protein MotB
MRRLPLSLVLSLSLAGAGCVSQGKYDAAVANAAKTRAESQRQRGEALNELALERAELARLRRSIADTEKHCGEVAADLDERSAQALSCARALDEATALTQGLKAELERAGKDVNQLLSVKSSLSVALEQARARLDELQRAQVAADQRAALFRDVALRLKRMIDAGELQIVLRSGRMVLVLPNDVLFDSGKAKIKPGGAEALGQVGAVLGSLEGRRFQVAGHTDDEPIRVSGFESNWELSSARALSVVHYLLKVGMKAESLSAAGYAEYDPVRPNDGVVNKAFNRRIEITLQPNIDEFVSVPRTR